MKKWKSLVSVLLALALALTAALPAFAAGESFTITAPDNGHTYEVYQIFTGDYTQSEGAAPVLSHIKWGENGTGTQGADVQEEVLTALAQVAASTSDAEKLEVILQYANLEGEAFGTVAGGSALRVPAGYYLIKDVDGSLEDQGDAVTLYIVRVVGDVTITPKSEDVPTVEKKVQEDSRASWETDFGYGYYEVADYEIGQTINFKLFGSIPQNLDDYDTYDYTFHDTMSSGLSLVEGEYIAYLVSDTSEEIGTLLERGTDYTFQSQVNEDGSTSITIQIQDLKALAAEHPQAQYIMVRYQAKLNENAQIGTDSGNPNQVYLEFSNDPSSDSTGKTPTEYVIVFTYTLHGDKVDGSYENTTEQAAKLEGAQFVLLNATGTQVAVVSGDGSTNQFVSWAALPGGGTDASSISYQGWAALDEETPVILTSNNLGSFLVNGLDEGAYQLLEIQAPAGYNKLAAPIEIVITSHLNFDREYANNPADAFVGADEVTVTADGEPGRCESGGRVSVTIANNKGTTLPETGGMGTTLFYVAGSALVVGAGLLLVIKRRARS